MDPIVFLLVTGGPKTAHVPPPFADLFCICFQFNTENDVLLIKAYC